MLAWQMAAAVVSGAATVGLGASVSHRLLSYRNTWNDQEAPSEGFRETSLDRYRPMARLMDPEDLRFVGAEQFPVLEAGYTRQVAARLRDSRRRIFRMYLAELSADFQRLHAAARRMVAEAPEQHAGLVPVLMRQQIAFWRSLAAIELRLALSWAGLAPADASGLLKIVGDLQRALAAAAPMPASA
ncbi:MAG TPA: hypothetical protein VN841_04295 [Bryobacteraceae bacterium]|nr:hypothetical protein [Bryobacteraceae bacterium]